MTSVNIPWIELAILAPLVGAFWVRWLRDPDAAREHSLWISGFSLVCTCAAWLFLDTQGQLPALPREQWDVLGILFARNMFVMDEVSAPLLPLVALLFFLTELATLRTKVRRFSFASVLTGESILLATFACIQPWVIAGLLAAGTIPPWLELRERHKPTRVYVVHMALFVGLLVAGLAIQSFSGGRSPLAAVLLMAAILVRSGIVPLHCWMTDLFEHASFGTALLFVTPIVGAYAAVRLVLPIAPDWVLRSIALLSLLTAVYAACMALVQHEARRFFCYVFLSHSSLVLVGMEVATTVGLTGALCVWLAVALSLAGFGLTLRSVEARTGRLSLDQFHGLYEHMPTLAILFLVTGLGSIGFPGTLGFVGTELLLEGVRSVYPFVGTAIVAVGALNGLAVLHAYFRVFTGARHVTSIDLRIRGPEQIAMLILTALILGGGLYPQPGVISRYQAAVKLIEKRQERLVSDEALPTLPP
ncbi:MAG TPA: proton-conducting transporter membrane subunit [Pirellulaceae bacterium]|nr:proton-conducting transporter membrane subunit [Pirellulaceae bacterium]